MGLPSKALEGSWESLSRRAREGQDLLGVLCRNPGGQRYAEGPGLAGPMSPRCPSSSPPSHPSLGTVTQALHPLPHSPFQGHPASQNCPGKQGLEDVARFFTMGKSRPGALTNLPWPCPLRSGRAFAGSWGCGLFSAVLAGFTQDPSLPTAALAPLSHHSPLCLLASSRFLSFGTESPRAC